jgi:hypothetical protein
MNNLMEKEPLALGRWLYSMSLAIISIGFGGTCSFVLYAMIKDGTFESAGVFGDYIGGTVGTAVAVMNMGAFLVLTYAIGAAQQKSHAQQLELQRDQHKQQLKLQIEQHEKQLDFHRHAQLFTRREDSMNELKPRVSLLLENLNAIQVAMSQGESPMRNATVICSEFTFNLNQFKTLFFQVNIYEISAEIRKHGRIIDEHSHPMNLNFDLVLDSIMAISEEVQKLLAEMSYITYKNLIS